jgi:thiol:disulfide interchange protein
LALPAFSLLTLLLMLLLNFRRLVPLLLHPLLWGAASLALAMTCHAQTQVLGSGKVNHEVQTPQVKATLLVNAPQGISAGQTLWLGLELTHQAHWHTYWKNPGDSGLPTELTWKLPAGLSAGPLIWPVPKKIPIGTLANFGYEDKVLLVTPVQVDKAFKPEGPSVNIQLRANWLVCKQECIPQEGDFQLSVPVNGASAMASAAFQKVLQYQASPLHGLHEARIAEDGRTLHLTLANLPTELQKGEWTLFPQTANVIQNNAAPVLESETSDPNSARKIKVRISSERMDSPKQMSWLLVQGKAEAPTGLQWAFDTPVQGQWRELTDEPQAADKLKLSTRPTSNTLEAPLATWALALLGALAGGLLLNLMPCVFPVLAIKLLSISQHSQSTKHMKGSAWAFTAGVLLSFLLLGALMLAFRAAGAQLGWGFQLQSPWVVGGLALLFAVMGLNLSGMFEFGAFVPSSVAGLQWSRPWVNALWSGVFAVVIASPCTAPFMGASLGLAIGLPTWQALPIFGAMGVGMALPFMALTVSTKWVEFLPRPGAWMVTFRQFMAFPMYATVLWLVWVLGQQVGLEGVIGFLICLLSLALVLWALPQQGKVGWGLRVLALVVLALSVWYWGPSWTRMDSAAATDKGAFSADNTPKGNVSGVIWEAWSEEKVTSAREAGQAVFIDFTAAWCVTCQFNKKTTFSQPEVLASFAQKKVLLLRADWTRYDPAITKALNAMGRNGVPVYAWYAPGQSVQLLSELPSVAEIQNALRQVKASP